MIQYHQFTKRFGMLVAVSRLDLEIRRGETLALIGPNGSGKSTTLKASLGLVRPTGGRVTVDGIDVGVAGRDARARTGYLPQKISFPEGCTAREVMRFFCRLRGVSTSECDALLDRVDLLAAADRVAERFSGGMKQRLGIAVALLGGPDALILDEPTAALDPTGSLTVRDLIAEIRSEGTTVLLSSHDLAEVGALADRVAIFVAGRIVAVGALPELVRTLALPVSLQVGLGGRDGESMRAVEGAGGRCVRWDGHVLHCEVAAGAEPAVLNALRSCGIAFTEISVRNPGLEEVYRAATSPHLLRVA